MLSGSALGIGQHTNPPRLGQTSQSTEPERTDCARTRVAAKLKFDIADQAENASRYQIAGCSLARRLD